MGWGTHYEWRAFGDLNEVLRDSIRALKKKFGDSDHGREEKDQYLWMPGCAANVKVRGSNLKIKRLTGCSSLGFHEWLEDEKENFTFPLSGDALKALGEIFPNALPLSPSAGSSGEELLKLFRNFSGIKVIRVEKHRIQYITFRDNAEVTIELAEICQPRSTESLCLESNSAKAISIVMSDLKLPDGLQEMDYLGFLSQDAFA